METIDLVLQLIDFLFVVVHLLLHVVVFLSQIRQDLKMALLGFVSRLYLLLLLDVLDSQF